MNLMEMDMPNGKAVVDRWRKFLGTRKEFADTLGVKNPIVSAFMNGLTGKFPKETLPHEP